MKFNKGDIVKYDVTTFNPDLYIGPEEIYGGSPQADPLYTKRLRGVVLKTSEVQHWRTMLWSPQVLVRWATIDVPQWVHDGDICLVSDEV
tara:strand:+ start:112 stop:381 length:270 start_codon:yes stop_codon:yes gene_type:complete